MRHWEKERAGVKLNSWPEIGSDGDVLWTPYVPKGITGYDDDDDKYIRNIDRQLISEEDTFLWLSKGRPKSRN